MKYLNLFIAAMFLITNLQAAKENKVNSKIKHVTIFTSGAQIERSASFNINAGLSEIIFEGVSPYINNKSIQAKGLGNYIILDVQFRVKQPEPIPPHNEPLPPRIVRDIALLSDSISQLNFDLEDLTNKREFIMLEKKVLLGNKYMQGNVDTITELKFAMDYLRKQLSDINTTLMKIKREEFVLNKKRTKMQARLTKLQAYNSKVNPVKKPEGPKYQVVVSVQSKSAISGKMEITYMVNNAGWTPAYDIRANGVGQPIQLVYKANVYQNSGEEWKDAKLTLSTIMPNQNYTKPLLPVLYASYYIPNVYKSSRKLNRSYNSAPAEALSDSDIYAEEFKSAESAAAYTQANYTMTNVEYNIDLPYTIPSDGQYHMVAIQDNELNAEYFHYLVPKLDKQAFLVAKITEWGSLDLLPGAANIYFEGTYVGETSLNTNIMADTLELALGKDRGVFAERKKKDEKVQNQKLGKDAAKTITYSIKIKSNKLTSINLIVEDQMPISQNEEITIRPLDIGKAKFAETTGMLTWHMKLTPKSTKTLEFSYVIGYDKNKQLANVY
jgi:uncharacterized protein (TIGR02231 family)